MFFCRKSPQKKKNGEGVDEDQTKTPKAVANREAIDENQNPKENFNMRKSELKILKQLEAEGTNIKALLDEMSDLHLDESDLSDGNVRGQSSGRKECDLDGMSDLNLDSDDSMYEVAMKYRNRLKVLNSGETSMSEHDMRKTDLIMTDEMSENDGSLLKKAICADEKRYVRKSKMDHEIRSPQICGRSMNADSCSDVGRVLEDFNSSSWTSDSSVDSDCSLGSDYNTSTTGHQHSPHYRPSAFTAIRI